MDLLKVIGAVLIVLGLLFRAISIAYFRVREPYVENSAAARRRFAASRRNALLIDGCFFVAGALAILGR